MINRSQTKLENQAPKGAPATRGALFRLLAPLISTLPILMGASNGTLSVLWDANTESDLSGYYLYWRTQSGSYTQLPVIILKPAISYPLTGLDPSLFYCVEMKAFDTSGNLSGLSNEACGQPTAAICGNGIKEAGEGCDDGNTASGDGCSATCQREVCGNAILDPGEGCDDGNTVSGDGCSASCQPEGTAPVVTKAVDVSSGTGYLIQCAQRTIRVEGSNFRSGAVVSFADTSISVSPPSSVSSTAITVNVSASATTPLGAKTIRVTNTDGSFGSVSGSSSVEVVKNPDFTHNGPVGAEDFNLLAIAFGSQVGSPSYNATVNMNGDNFVDGLDLSRFVPFLGQAVTSCP